MRHAAIIATVIPQSPFFCGSEGNYFALKHSSGIRSLFLILCQIWYFNMLGIWSLSLDFVADMFFFSLIFYSLYLGNYSLLKDIVLFIGETAVMS